MDKPGYTKGPWKATRSNPADVSTQGQGDVVERLRAAAREIRNDGTASQVGLSEQECEDIADEITRLRALLSSSRGEQGWRTIDSAPKDRLIDIWIQTSDTGVRWSECYYDSICDEWRTSRPSGHLVSVKARWVTHWMPLPSAPGSVPTSLAGQGTDERALLEEIDAVLDAQVYGLPPRSDPTPYAMRDAGQDLPPDYQHDVIITEALWDKIRAALAAAPQSGTIPEQAGKSFPETGNKFPGSERSVSAPQPTAGGDAAPLEPLEWLNKALSRLEGVNEIDVPAAVAAAMTEAYAFVYATRNALSAERARVIDEASTWILGLEAAIRECIDFIESDMAEMAVYETERVLEDPTILERRPSFLPPVRPALRALGQQDTGEQ
jgi:hypothetical protein